MQTTAVILDGLTLDAPRPPVGSVAVDVGSYLGDDGLRSGFVEEDDIVDAGKGSEHLCPLVPGHYRPALALVSLDGSIRVHRDDECVPLLFRFFETAYVSDVKNVERSVHRNDLPSLRSKPICYAAGL